MDGNIRTRCIDKIFDRLIDTHANLIYNKIYIVYLIIDLYI